MVESSIMEESRQRGESYFFEGTVGEVNEETIQVDSKATWPDVSADCSGRLQVSSETQIELSQIVETANSPEIAVKQGRVVMKKVIATPRNARHG
jgi:hypothetical protein